MTDANIDRRRFLEWAGIAPVGLASAGCSTVTPGGRAATAADCWIEVSRPHIAHNLAQIRRRVGNRPVMGVIKGNAYGHGLVEVGRILERHGVDALAVGKLDEALRLRDGGVRAPVLNLGPLLPDHAEDIVRHHIAQTVYTDEFFCLEAAAKRFGIRALVHVNVDTGLGRVGVPHKHALAFLERLNAATAITIGGVFTALTEDRAFDTIQLQRLLHVCDRAKARGIAIPLRHAASSAACLEMPAAWLDMVRPGITLYGHYPSDAAATARPIDLRPAMQLKARVSQVKTLLRGESVSYHRAFVAPRATKVATLAIGYSDGFPHRGAEEGEVIIGGERRKTIALVTANHTTVDVTGLDVELGDTATLFGQQGDAVVSATEVAKWSGTSVYKTLIEMNPLLPRRFV